MYNNVSSIKIWENNKDTPLSASNLSKLIDFQANSKFISLTNDVNDIKKWSDYFITGVFPTTIQSDYINNLIYNIDTSVVKKAIFDLAANNAQWYPSRGSDDFSIVNRVLKISRGIQVSMNYVDKTSQERVYLNFDLGDENQMLSFDDILSIDDEISNFIPNTTYSIILLHRFSYGDNAYLKILRQNDESRDFWRNQSENGSSPTGFDHITHRKLGGFRTNDDGEIVESSIWDLFTYKKETSVDELKVYENGFVRQLNASDIAVRNQFNLFNASNIEGSLEETRYLVNGMRDQFYTNRRFGVNLRYTPFLRDASGGMTPLGVNAISIVISPGIIDVFSSQKQIDDNIFLNEVGVGLRINDNSNTGVGDRPHDGSYVFNTNSEDQVTLGNGVGQLKPGVWRVLLDSSSQILDGNILLLHDNAEKPKLDHYTHAWFDNSMNRCIGKFKVRESSESGVFYIEKMSVVDTYDQRQAPNTLHLLHSTVVPDGLLLCDGRWHDVNGLDDNSYTYQQLVDQKSGDWGDSWYEETPNLQDKFLKMPPSEYLFMNQAENFILPTGEEGLASGGSRDCGREGGTSVHSHSFPHSHDAGNLNIYSSGSHPQKHDITFVGGTDSVNVETIPVGGTSVSVSNHTHNTMVDGGEHSHPTESINGEVGRIEGSSANTSSEDVLPPYKEVLICIKK